MSGEITFDPAKRLATLEARGLDFADAADVFQDVHRDFEDLRFDYGEPRILTIGLLKERMVALVWTPRGPARHIISMRKCNDREQKKYRSLLV